MFIKKIITVLVFSSSFIGLKAQIITTIAGNNAYGQGYSGDGGPATAAEFNSPWRLTVDTSGNLFIADYVNNVVRKVDKSGIITTVAGNGYSLGNYTGDGGPATDAELYFPIGIAFDGSANLYIGDDYNNVIRKVNSAGIISTVVGNHVAGYSGDGGPASAAELQNLEGIVFDASGNLFIADDLNHVVRKVNTFGIISTVAGNHIAGYSGDGGPATAAELQNPDHVTIDSSGNLFIADFNNWAIRMVNAAGIISTVAGNGYKGGGFGGYSGDGGPATAAELSYTEQVLVDHGYLYIADAGNGVIRMVDKAGIIHTIAGVFGGVSGSGGGGYAGDGGPALLAHMWYPAGFAIDKSGNFYIADARNYVVRKVTNITGINEIKQAESVSIYPNPNSGIFTIALGHAELVSASQTIEVYNVLGEKIPVATLKLVQGDYTLNISNQPPGIYFYRVIDERGGVIGSGKVVIEK